MKSILLLVPEKTDPELDNIFRVWNSSGGRIKRLGKFWERDEFIATQKIAIYGNQTFALILAQLYNVNLISPDDTTLARLDIKWTKRIVELKAIEELDSSNFPVFIKPVIPKAFTAGIFPSLNSFDTVTSDFDKKEQVIISSIIDDIVAECRSYILNGNIVDMAIYEGSADLKTGLSFLSDFIQANCSDLPKTLVVDLGYSATRGWFILEFNACWGAGLNGCNPEKVIDCIIAATEN